MALTGSSRRLHILSISKAHQAPSKQLDLYMMEPPTSPGSHLEWHVAFRAVAPISSLSTGSEEAFKLLERL